MLKFVHHIQYAVNSRDEFVAYMEKNFGLKPDEVEVGQMDETELEAISNNPRKGGLWQGVWIAHPVRKRSTK